MVIFKVKDSVVRPRVNNDYVLLRSITDEYYIFEKLKGTPSALYRNPDLSLRKIKKELFDSEIKEGKIIQIKTYTLDKKNGIIKI